LEDGELISKRFHTNTNERKRKKHPHTFLSLDISLENFQIFEISFHSVFDVPLFLKYWMQTQAKDIRVPSVIPNVFVLCWFLLF
jgi:hypothetical protein